MAVRAHRRSSNLVRCARCGQLVNKDNALKVETGYVGGACLQLLLSQARSGEGVYSVGS